MQKDSLGGQALRKPCFAAWGTLIVGDVNSTCKISSRPTWDMKCRGPLHFKSTALPSRALQ
eukprot:1347080-Prymnesium_polylepis.1